MFFAQGHGPPSIVCLLISIWFALAGHASLPKDVENRPLSASGKVRQEEY